jgi:hypothetical protein
MNGDHVVITLVIFKFLQNHDIKVFTILIDFYCHSKYIKYSYDVEMASMKHISIHEGVEKKTQLCLIYGYYSLQMHIILSS